MGRTARRILTTTGLVGVLLVAAPSMAMACGGLIAPGHAEVLRRASTLAAWHEGFEHYVTGFTFAGSAESFGYIIPLPENPSKIEAGGDWTLERLAIEVNQIRGQDLLRQAAGAPAAYGVTVLQQVRVEALDITVVEGGGPDVAAWAEENGFVLTTDAPDMMKRYSDEGAIFALAKFDNEAAREQGFVEGQGTVIHFTIPTAAPWVPLQILSLGKHQAEFVDADLYVLTDDRPRFWPDPGTVHGWEVTADDVASKQLLADLGSDEGMGWMPASGMWLTGLTLHTPSWTVDYDLSIDGGGPPLAAPIPTQLPFTGMWPMWLALATFTALIAAGIRSARSGRSLRPA